MRGRRVPEQPPGDGARGVPSRFVGLERQGHVHVEAVLAELADQLAERVVLPGGDLPAPARLSRNRTVQAVLDVEGYRNQDPVGVQRAEPVDVLRGNERTGPPASSHASTTSRFVPQLPEIAMARSGKLKMCRPGPGSGAGAGAGAGGVVGAAGVPSVPPPQLAASSRAIRGRVARSSTPACAVICARRSRMPPTRVPVKEL